MNAKNRNQFLLAVAASAAVVASALSPALARPSEDEAVPSKAARPSVYLDAVERREQHLNAIEWRVMYLDDFARTEVKVTGSTAELDAALRAQGLNAPASVEAPATSRYLDAFERRAREVTSAALNERSE